jgi:hypothetical protein
MPDAKQRRPDLTRDRAARTVHGATGPADVAGPADADTDALRLATDRRIATIRRADQAALAAAVRDLWSRGRTDYVR